MTPASPRQQQQQPPRDDPAHEYFIRTSTRSGADQSSFGTYGGRERERLRDQSPKPQRASYERDVAASRAFPQSSDRGGSTGNLSLRAAAFDGTAEKEEEEAEQEEDYRPRSTSSYTYDTRPRYNPPRTRPDARSRSTPFMTTRDDDDDDDNDARTGTGRRQGMRESSPTGSSSPPRGLKESYDRILVEENLAAEESAMAGDLGLEEHSEGMSGDWGVVVNPVHLKDPASQHRGSVDRRRRSRSPASSFPTSVGRRRRRSPPSETYAGTGMAGNQDHDRENDTTAGSGSASVVSGLSSLDDASDESFARNLARHARDQQRISGALKGDVKLFSKARRRERGSLTAENLQRRNSTGHHPALNGKLENETAASGSLSSFGSDPPINLPKDWGRKGRKGRDWLSRIAESEGKRGSKEGNGEESPSGPGARRGGTRDRKPDKGVDRIAEASEVPVPSIEDGSSSLRVETPQKRDPPSTSKRNVSLDMLENWEIDDEFTARSLQISTSPPLKTRKTTLDRIREREIEALKEQAVTQSRLGEIRERTSKELLRSKSSAAEGRPRSNGLADDGDDELPGSMNASRVGIRSTTGISLPVSKDQTLEEGEISRVPIVEDEGDAIPNTPIVIYKSPPTTSHNTNANQRSDHDREPRGDVVRRAKQSETRTQDSQSLLRMLARATSASPSPARDEKPTGNTDKEKEDGTGSAEAEAETKAEKSARSSSPLQDKARVKQPGDAATTRPTRKSDIEDQTPKPEAKASLKPTPAMAIGGWVDTPGRSKVQKARTRATSPPSNLDVDVDAEISALGLGDFIRGPSSSPLYQRGGGLDGRPPRDPAPRHRRSNLGTSLAAPTNPSTSLLPTRANPLKPAPPKGKAPPPDVEDMDMDTTTDSIEAMIANDPGFASLLHNSSPSSSTTSSDAGADDNDNANATPHKPHLRNTNAARQRRHEMRDLDRMQAKLRKALVSIHDTKRGIEGLETQVESSTNIGGAGAITPHSGSGGGGGGALWCCPQCGLGVRPPLACTRWHWAHLLRRRNPLPALYYWGGGGEEEGAQQQWRPRLTWFGVVFVLGWAYILSELLICEYHCRVYYATKTSYPYGINPNAVDPPFVTYKYLRRRLPWLLSSLETVLGTYWKLIRFLWRGLMALLRSDVGVGGGGGLQPGQGQERDGWFFGGRSSREEPWGGHDDWGVGDDEYI
ncbi:MAG: hypothetical protein M1837_006587 [Sclerophora amabilis]|nr:MAG: hypothetical protein M1837_006587 [Sclerophora amabilis]